MNLGYSNMVILNKKLTKEEKVNEQLKRDIDKFYFKVKAGLAELKKASRDRIIIERLETTESHTAFELELHSIEAEVNSLLWTMKEQKDSFYNSRNTYIMKDTDLMPFGAHKGKRMIDVPASYLLWFYEENKAFKTKGDGLKVWKYAEDNLEVLKSQTRK